MNDNYLQLNDPNRVKALETNNSLPPPLCPIHLKTPSKYLQHVLVEERLLVA